MRGERGKYNVAHIFSGPDSVPSCTKLRLAKKTQKSSKRRDDEGALTKGAKASY